MLWHRYYICVGRSAGPESMCQNFALTHKHPLTHCLGSLAGIIVFFLLSFLWVLGFGTYWKVYREDVPSKEPSKDLPLKAPSKKICFLKFRQEDLLSKASSRRLASESSIKKICLQNNNKSRFMSPEVDTVLAETVFAEIVIIFVIVLLSFWSLNPGRFLRQYVLPMAFCTFPVTM